MARPGATKELLEIMSDPGDAASKKTDAPAPPQRRRRWSPLQARLALGLLIVLALISPLILRWITFDPASYVAGIRDELEGVSPAETDALRALQAASRAGSLGQTVLQFNVAEFEERQRRVQANRQALLQRYHRGTSFCGRYWTEPAVAEAVQAEQAAKAIVAAGLVHKLTELAVESLRWEVERDQSFHSAEHAQEVLQFLSEREPLWTRLGLWLRRSASLNALRAVLRPPPASEQKRLHGDDLQRGKALWSQFGPLMPAVTQVLRWKYTVDLAAPHLRLVHPGMTAAQAIEILHDPARAQAPRDLRIGTDDQQLVSLVRWEAQTDPCVVRAHGKMLGCPTLAEVVRELGQPAATEEKDVLVYDREGFRQRILFSEGRLAAVELKRSDIR